MKKDCKYIQDLLLSYVEGLTNIETNQYIEEHLKECVGCKKILENMQEKLSTDTEKTEKKTIKYFKRYNRELRVLQILLIIILIAFVINIGRKFIILEDLSKKFEITSNLNNFYMRTEGYSIKNYGEYSVRNMNMQERYYKDGNNYAIIKMINEDGLIKEYVFYKNDENEMLLAKTTKEGETNISNNITYNGNIAEAGIIPTFYTDNNAHSKLYMAIFYKIDKIEIEGKCYYLIRNKISDSYIEADTGLTKKVISINNFSTTDYYYEFGNVQDSDILITNF